MKRETFIFAEEVIGPALTSNQVYKNKWVMVEKCEDRFLPSRSIDHEPPETFHSGDVFSFLPSHSHFLTDFYNLLIKANFVFTDVNCKFIWRQSPISFLSQLFQWVVAVGIEMSLSQPTTFQRWQLKKGLPMMMQYLPLCY